MSELPQQPLQRLADAVREARLQRPEGHTTQEILAEDVRGKTSRKLTAGAISQIETGRIRPEIETVEALAEVLGPGLRDTIDYRLMLARRNLDERIVGLETAVANLAIAPVDALPPTRSAATTPPSRADLDAALAEGALRQQGEHPDEGQERPHAGHG